MPSRWFFWGRFFSEVKLLLSQDACAHVGQSWERFKANSKQSLALPQALGERTQVCLHLTPSVEGR